MACLAAVTFLFVTWAGGGNATPVLGLATRLARRGHGVRVASPDDMGARFTAAGVEHEVIPRQEGAVLALIIREAPAVVVVDFMMPSWMNQATASGVGWVALVHTLYDRIGAGILTAFTTLDDLNEERRTLGLTPVGDPPAILDAAARVLVTAPARLDDAALLPPNTTHVGAVLEEAGPDAGWRPPPGDDPLIVVSPGTTPGLNEAPVVERILGAVSAQPVRVIVSVGAHLDPGAFAPPPNVTLGRYVRHGAVLPYASAMVTHAGLGSICAGLSHGLPLVCVPLDRDQPHNAERVVACGAGERVEREAGAQELWAAIERVLTVPRYRAAAETFAAEYDPEATGALAELESALPRPALG